MPNKLTLLVTLLLFLFVAPASNSYGDVVFIDGQPPIYGLFISEIAGVIEFEKLDESANGQQTITIPRSQVARLVRTIDSTLLSQLSPDHPARYRDFAEVVGSYASDPFAQSLARRLYLLSAYWGRGEVRSSGFRGMIGLAKRPERTRIQAFAFQLDSNFDRSWFDQVDFKSRNEGRQQIGSDRQHASQLFECVRLIRNQRYEEAGKLLNSLEKTGAPNRASARLMAILKQVQIARRASLAELSLIIQAEVDWITAEENQPDWNKLVRDKKPDFRILSFETVSEFDPKKCVFRRGRWTEPVSDR